MSRVIAVLLALCLAACGMKTALVLPAKPASEPLLGNPTSAKPTAKSTVKQPTASAPDVSTDTKTNSQ